jgi:uncharacterized protein YndB with AHSA1/START domain
MDFRNGGKWHLTMHGPGGRDYENYITFTEIVKNKTIAFQHGGGPKAEPVNHRTHITFEEVGGKTKINFRMTFISPEAKDFVVTTYQAVEGLNGTLSRLEELLAGQTGSKARGVQITLPSDTEIMLRRVFDAPAALVFDASTKPEHIAVWWSCGGSKVEAEADLRVGGSFKYKLHLPDGQVFPFKGVYREFDRPRKIVHTQILDVAPYNAHEILVTVTFVEENGKTTLTSLIQHTTKEGRDMHLMSGLEEGAGFSMDRLAELVWKLS